MGGFLSHSVLALLRLRPLIESGIVLPVAMNSLDCEHTIDRSRQLLALAEELADDAARQMLDRFEIKFQLPEKSGLDEAAFRVTGPEDFLEHGSLWLIGGEPPNWRLKSWRYDSNGQVKLRGARKLELFYVYCLDERDWILVSIWRTDDGVVFAIWLLALAKPSFWTISRRKTTNLFRQAVKQSTNL